jgi:hypothetical protein
MPRPERPLDPDSGAVARFAFELRQVRVRAGNPPYRTLGRHAHYSSATLAKAADGSRLPSLAVTLAYVRACGGDESYWADRWQAVAAEVSPGVAAGPSTEDGPGDVAPPYPGAAAFTRDDADRFGGRAGVTAELAEVLCRHRFAALVGPSGHGKSSLLNAALPGAVPADVVLTTTPGSDPDQHVLAGCRAGDDVLLVVDQFEEVFLRDEPERTRFVDGLLDAVRGPGSRTRVVLGIRSDALSRCAEHRELSGALREARVALPPIAIDDLRAAITRPAVRSGCTVEGALVAQLVGEAAGAPGALPLVGVALREAWRRRRGNALTLAAHRSCGGLPGIAVAVAEEAWAALAPDCRDRARDVLLRLVTVGEGAAPGVRRARHDEFDDDPLTARTLRTLAAARLVVLDEDGVELAHRALAESWPRLCGWVAEDGAGLAVHRRLTEAARAWAALDREPAALYRGTRLATAQRWAEANDAALTALEREFLRAGVAAGRPRGRRAVYRWSTVTVAVALVAGTAGALNARPDLPSPSPAQGGTGRADVVTVGGTPGGTVVVRPLTAGFPALTPGPPVDAGLDGLTPPPDLTRFADLTGDGRDELITINRDGTITAWKNDGSFPRRGWGTFAEIGREWSGDPAAIHFADVDGDGLADLIGVDTADDAILRVWTNTGAFPGWPWADPVGLGLGRVDLTRARFADLTGDGRADLVTETATGGLRLGRGTGAVPGWPWADPVSLGPATGSGLSGLRFADLDGDGYADLVTVGADGALTARRNTHDLAHRPWDTPVRIAPAGRGTVHFAQVAD